MTVESVQVNQVYLEWIGAPRSFGMVARPLEFLSSFTLRLPTLELRWERHDSFPKEAGKWMLTPVQPQLDPGYPKHGRRGERHI